MCDTRFAFCLNKVNNRQASFIFNTYFNVLFRRGFCATLQPSEEPMGFTRGFNRFWEDLVHAFRSLSDSSEDTDERRQTVSTFVARQLKFTTVFSSTNTTHGANSYSIMNSTPSLTQAPQTVISSSSSSSFLRSFLMFPVSTTTSHDHESISTPSRSQQETTSKRLEFTSLFLKRISNPCNTDPITIITPSPPDAAVVSKSISAASSSSPTPPLPYITSTTEDLPHPKETEDLDSHTAEYSSGKRREKVQNSERHLEHAAHEQEKVASSQPVNESNRGKKEQGSNVLCIISFRLYIEEYWVQIKRSIQGREAE